MKKWAVVTAKILIGSLVRKSVLGVWITNEITVTTQSTYTSFSMPMRL